MSKITIVSRDDQALLIDIGGCTSFKEAIEQLSSTFLSSNHFWQDQAVDLNLGSLLLSDAQANQIIALIKGVGANIKLIFARSASTFSVLEDMQLVVSKEQPDSLLSISVVAAESELGESLSKTSAAESKITEDLASQDTSLSPDAIQLLPLDLKDGEEIITVESGEVKTESKISSKPANEIKKRNCLYLRQTLRAGQAVSHKGDLVIIGDVNAGAEVMAQGDITIWGSLRGIAHAGIDGDTKAEIRALRLQPIQIRIADAIARSPDGPKSSSQHSQYSAETAKLVNGKIRILHKSFDG